MANASRGEVSLSFDGQEYVLKLSNHRMRQIETSAKMPFLDIVELMEKGSISLMTVMLWRMIGSKGGDPTSDTEDPVLVDRMFDELGHEEIAGKLGQCMELAYPQKEEKAGGKPKAATGK